MPEEEGLDADHVLVVEEALEELRVADQEAARDVPARRLEAPGEALTRLERVGDGRRGVHGAALGHCNGRCAAQGCAVWCSRCVGVAGWCD